MDYGTDAAAVVVVAVMMLAVVSAFWQLSADEIRKSRVTDLRTIFEC